MQNALFAVRARPNGLAAMRVAVSSPRAVGRAVARNRARRRVREAFAAEIRSLAHGRGHDLLIVARQGSIDASFDAIRGAARAALATIGGAS